jgi:hypothetical protein
MDIRQLYLVHGFALLYLFPQTLHSKQKPLKPIGFSGFPCFRNWIAGAGFEPATFGL